MDIMSKNPKIEKYLQSLSALSKSTDDYLFVWDIENNAIWFFGAVEEKFAIKQPNQTFVTPAQMMSIVYEKDVRMLSEKLIALKNGAYKEHNLDYRWVDKSGNIVWINCRGTVIDDENGSPMVLLGRVSQNAFDLKYNKLTGVFNRQKMLEDAVENKILKKSGQFLLLGLDRIVKVHSERGREFVEYVLQSCARIFENELEDDEALYHAEDDIFVVTMLGAKESRVREYYDRVTEKIKDKITITAISLPFSKNCFVDEVSLYKTARKELSFLKKESRARLSFFSKKAILEQIDLQGLSQQLEKSVSNGFEGFSVNYQPLIRGDNYSIYGVEALMRFTAGGVTYPPLKFIPLLEQTGLMHEAGLWVLKTALEQVKEWRKKIPDLHLNVNFSLAQLEDETIVDDVIRIFNESGLPPKSLIIELTETMKVEHVEKVSMITRTWNMAGIEISIDDFGTGYSNLALLKDIECDEIKIERTFVSNVEEGSYGYLLINSVIEFARANEIRVCCEGVETEDDVLILSRLMPDTYQGFVFDKPCTAQEFTDKYVDSSTKEYRRRKTFRKHLLSKSEELITKFDPSKILYSMGVGLCVMRDDLEKEEYELHPDKTIESMFGMESDLTPKECNKFWFSRIKPGYADFVRKSLIKLVENDKVGQFVYPWIHPTKGEILISFSGMCVKREGSFVEVKGLHRIVSAIERIGDKERARPLRYFMEKKYMDIMMSNALAFMEINLTQNKVLGGLSDIVGNQPELGEIGRLLEDEDGNLGYEEFENWWADRYLVSSREEFSSISNCNYLMDCYARGKCEVELYCRGVDRFGKIYDCKKTFFICKDEILGDITALCVMYDVSEQVKEKIEFTYKNNTIRAMCDEFKAIMHVNLEDDTVVFYREDETLGCWKEGMNSFSGIMRAFADRFVAEKDRADFKYIISSKSIRRKLLEEGSFRFEYGRICADGIVRSHEIKVKRDESNALSSHVIVGVKDIDQDVKLRNKLKEALNMAYTDHLTGLNNQQGLAIKGAELLKDTSVKSAVMFMDLDNFKLVNDAYGHGTGDKVLVEVGKILKGELRGKDIVGRYGGDEFVALMYDVKEKSEAEEMANNILRRIKDLCKKLSLKVELTASIGVSYTSDCGYDYRYLKEIADDNLYIAKKRGKDIVVVDA